MSTPASRDTQTDHPVHELIARRWSPYGYADRDVPAEALRSLFEAARWAASSYNEQPWSYIVASRTTPDEFQRLLSCLVEPNQAWAASVPVLALGLTSTVFSRNQNPNGCAEHDLGLASAQLTLEATARGLVVHQMAGILPDRARELYGVPDHVTIKTGLAIGYAAEDLSQVPEALRERDESPRQRKPLAQFVFTGKWGEASPLVY